MSGYLKLMMAEKMSLLKLQLQLMIYFPKYFNLRFEMDDPDFKLLRTWLTD